MRAVMFGFNTFWAALLLGSVLVAKATDEKGLVAVVSMLLGSCNAAVAGYLYWSLRSDEAKGGAR